MFRLAILTLAMLVTALAHAQPSKPVPVVIEHSGDDNVGQRLAFELREVVRGSKGMRLVTANEANPRVTVIVVTINPSRELGSASTAASIAITYDADTLSFQGYYIASSVQICGANRTRECARDIAASIDSAIVQLRRDYPARWERLQR